MKHIKKEIANIKEEEIAHSIEEIEATKEDSTRMYKAIRKMVREKPQTIIVNDAEGTTCNEKRATEEITKHFNNMFNTDTAKEFFARPQPMQQPFTSEEVKTAANRLKNNKSAGIDDITAEHLKHAPQEVYQEIADIFNNIAETGEFPLELTRKSPSHRTTNHAKETAGYMYDKKEWKQN